MSIVQIKIATVDLTADIVFATAFFESAVNGTTGSCKFRVRDSDRTLSFVTGDAIELLVDSNPVWTGYLETQARVYVFPAENVVDAGLTRWLDITGSDLNILFPRRIVFNPAAPATVLIPPLAPYPAHTPDTTAIAALVGTYLDLSGDGLDTSTFVENVADINVDQTARPFGGSDTFGQAMASIASLPGAVYFLDPARNLVYTDVNTASAPFGLSDQSSAGGVVLLSDDFGRTTTQGDGTPWVGGARPEGPSNSTYGLGPGYAWSAFDSPFAAYDNSLLYCDGSRVVLPSGGIAYDSYRVVGSFPAAAEIAFDFYVPASADTAAEAPATGMWYTPAAFATDPAAVWPSIYVFSNGDGTWQVGAYDTSLTALGPAASFTPTAASMYRAKMAYDTASNAVKYKVWRVGDAEPGWLASGTTTLSFITGGVPYGPPDGTGDQYPGGTVLVDFWAGAPTVDVFFDNLVIETVGTTTGYREMAITLDGASLANDVLAWGLGYGSNKPVFDRDTDAASVALHGLWQAGTLRSGIYKQATIERVADSIVYGSPSNQRGAKDDREVVTVVTYTPGFLPAQKVDFASTVFGFSDVIPIRRMRVTFDAPDTPKYELTLSHAIDSPFGFVDPFLFTLPRLVLPSLRITLPVTSTCATADDFLNRIGFSPTWSPALGTSPSASAAFGTPSGGAGAANLTDRWLQGGTGNTNTSTLATVASDGAHIEIHAEAATPLPEDGSIVYAVSDVAGTFLHDPTNLHLELDVELTFPIGFGGIAGDVQQTTIGLAFHAFDTALNELDATMSVLLSWAMPSQLSSATFGAFHGGIASYADAEGVAATGPVDPFLATPWLVRLVLDRNDTRGSTIFQVGDWLPVEVFHTSSLPWNGTTQSFELDLTLDFLAGRISPSTDRAALFRIARLNVCQSAATTALVNADTGSGVCENPARLDASTFQTSLPMTPGSLAVWRNGLIQRPTVDFTESPSNSRRFFFSEASPLTDTVYACYLVAS